jgi:hypothetical protein
MRHRQAAEEAQGSTTARAHDDRVSCRQCNVPVRQQTCPGISWCPTLLQALQVLCMTATVYCIIPASTTVCAWPEQLPVAFCWFCLFLQVFKASLAVNCCFPALANWLRQGGHHAAGTAQPKWSSGL